MAKDTLRKKDKAGGLMRPDFILNYEAMVIRWGRYIETDKYTNATELTTQKKSQIHTVNYIWQKNQEH